MDNRDRVSKYFKKISSDLWGSIMNNSFKKIEDKILKFGYIDTIPMITEREKANIGYNNFDNFIKDAVKQVKKGEYVPVYTSAQINKLANIIGNEKLHIIKHQEVLFVHI